MTTRMCSIPAVVESLRQLTPPGEPDVLAKCCACFSMRCRAELTGSKAAWTIQNVEELQRAAHSLRAVRKHRRAPHATKICKQLDERGKAGDFNGARHLMDSLDLEYSTSRGGDRPPSR